MISTDAIRQHYDSFAPVYRAFWGEHIHHGLFVHDGMSMEEAQAEMIDHCARLVTARSPSLRVFDVGCGFGATLMRLEQLFGCHGIGITLSPAEARTARNKIEHAYALEVFCENAETFPFPEGLVDIVWAMESTEHFFDKRYFFSNVARSLRPGGKLLLAARTGSSEESAVRDVATHFLFPEVLTADAYSICIEAAGLRLTVREDLTDVVKATCKVSRSRIEAVQGLTGALPNLVEHFVSGMDLLARCYESGKLRYTVLVAEK